MCTLLMKLNMIAFLFMKLNLSFQLRLIQNKIVPLHMKHLHDDINTMKELINSLIDVFLKPRHFSPRQQFSSKKI